MVLPITALLGTLWLAFNPLVLAFTHAADSHAPSLLFVTVGFWALLSFLKKPRPWRAWVAGLSLGYAFTVRYSEFLLIVPLFFAALLHWRGRRANLSGTLALVAGWGIPVVLLGCICWVSFGSPFKTGYTYCHEDDSFSTAYLAA